MHRSLRISLLYLFLLIPQHGNNPLPDMESWLQKDQDDGSVQHDLTSSLTARDESFGSAHQTYQNSLIKSGGSELDSPQTTDYSNFSRIKRRSPFFLGRNLKEESEEAKDSDKDEVTFEDLGSNPRISSGLYYPLASNQRLQNFENINPRYKNKFLRENQYIDVIPSQDLLHNNGMEGLDKDVNPRTFIRKRWKQRHALNPFLYYPQSMNDESLNYPIQEDYLNVDDERKNRELSDQEYKHSIEPDDKAQLFDENEYYDAEMNPLLGEEDFNKEGDYSQLLDNRRYLRKRDEARQAVPDDVKAELAAFDYGDQDERYTNNPTARKVRRDRMDSQYSAIKARGVVNKPDTGYVWKLNDDSHSQELEDLMKDSQRALQEVQLFQSKLAYKSPEIKNSFRGLKRENPKCKKRNFLFDGLRLKREDEDEQKNMKTGTDEGGGEYEDEEGKGHKDEEEYYEDADLSENELKSEGFAPNEMNQKYVKREILSDANLRRPKNEVANDQSEDYELNLENAPVEHADKSKKSTYREGEKTNKNTVRKGVKIWDHWGKWSPCSVTCGVGRSTRWRHCIGGGCAQGEKEAQIKRCTNPAC